MSRASGAGSFGHGPNIYQQQQSEFDIETRNLLDGVKPTKATAEQVKEIFEEAQRANEKLAISSRSADEFILLHPEILDTEKNGQLINKMLKSMFGDVAHTVEQIEAATQALLVTDSLDIDKAELAKQQQKATDAQRKAIVKRRSDAAARQFNPDADYDNLSLEELRERSDEQMRLAGQQEGANGF